MLASEPLYYDLTSRLQPRTRLNFATIPTILRMAAPPSKKHKHTPVAALASLSTAYSSLSETLIAFTTKSPLLTSSTNPTSIPRLLTQSESLLILLKEFTTARESAFEEEIGSEGWRDHLDAKGTEIWNRSIRIKGFDMEEGGESPWNRVVAKCKLLSSAT